MDVIDKRKASHETNYKVIPPAGLVVCRELSVVVICSANEKYDSNKTLHV